MLETTFEIANRDGGIYLLRGEKIYTLNHYSSKNPGIEYLPIQLNLKANSVAFFDYTRAVSGGFSFCGNNIPIPVLSKEDKIIVFSDNISDLELAEANLLGYSFYLVKGEKTYRGYDEHGDKFNFDKKIEFTITDSKDNIITDFSSLDKDEIYTLFYYEGTRYHEIKLRADCLQFDYNIHNAGNNHTVSGVLTKNGYAEYDISDVSSGTYFIGLNDGRVLDGILIQIGE